MKIQGILIVAGVALAATAISGCVETGPHHRFGGPGPVVVHHERDHRAPPRAYDRHDMHGRHDDHRSMSHRVDCRRDPRNPACHGHH